MSNYIFGYGSLIIPESAAKSLGRNIFQDMLLVDVKNYIRLWNLVVKVIIKPADNLVNAVFLNIQEEYGKVVNGVLIKVTADDLKKLDIREKQYRRINITNNVCLELATEDKVYTYIGRSNYLVNKYDSPKVLREYLKVLEGIRYWGRPFYDKFNLTTQQHNFEIVDGDYRFLDNEQNVITGHNKI